MKTLLILSHPDFKNSRVNKALINAAREIEGVEIRHLDEIYGDHSRGFDIKKEQELASKADRIVFQFPMYWLFTPAMLKGYIDEIFTRGWAYGDGKKLVGKELQIVVSSGASEAEFHHQGSVRSPIGEVLFNLNSMSNYCGMKFNKIFHIAGTINMNDDELGAYVRRYTQMLKG